MPRETRFEVHSGGTTQNVMTQQQPITFLRNERGTQDRKQNIPIRRSFANTFQYFDDFANTLES